MIAVQLPTGKIRCSGLIASGLTSGITSGQFGSIRNVDELSMTIEPAFANPCAISALASSLLAKITTSFASAMIRSVVAPKTRTSRSRNAR